MPETDSYPYEEESRDGLSMIIDNGRSVITPIGGQGLSSTLVLLLPGLSGNRNQWNLVIPKLADMPVELAHGAPILPHPALNHGKPTVTALARLIADELQAGEWKEVVIAAHSVGTFMALGIARLLPDLVKEVILVNGGLAGVAEFLDHPVHEMIIRPRTCLNALRLFVLVSTPVPAALKAAIAKNEKTSRLMLGNLVSDAAFETEEQRRDLMDESANPQVLRALWDNRHYWREFTGYAGKIRPKVLFLAGGQDPMGGKQDTQMMAALLPNAEIQVLPGIGHAAPLETSEAVAKAIRNAVEELVPGHLRRIATMKNIGSPSLAALG